MRRGRAKPLWRGHPWVFRDSIDRVDGNAGAGDLVEVADEDGRGIGYGFFSPGSKIAVRILGSPGGRGGGSGGEGGQGGGDAAEGGGAEPAPRPGRGDGLPVDTAFFRERIARALRLRHETLLLPVVTDGYRLVHSEGDYLPGLVVDRYARCLAVQFSTIGMHRRREMILDALEDLLSPAAIFELPDRRVCEIEGIETAGGLVRGGDPGEPPSIIENGVTFRIGISGGQKTGFYADQRDNRHLVGRLVRDRTVLDLYTYTGGFGLYAAVNGASHVVAIDSSGPALAFAAENGMLNHGRQVRFERADARDALNGFHRQRRRFDVVVCDPPRFARDRSSVGKALTAYRDLHLRAIRVVEPGGVLAASSCSGAVTDAQFEETLRDAAHDVGRSLQVLQRGGQAPDHPVLSTCPEGRYLKFVLACVT